MWTPLQFGSVLLAGSSLSLYVRRSSSWCRLSSNCHFLCVLAVLSMYSSVCHQDLDWFMPKKSPRSLFTTHKISTDYAQKISPLTVFGTQGLNRLCPKNLPAHCFRHCSQDHLSSMSTLGINLMGGYQSKLQLHYLCTICCSRAALCDHWNSSQAALDSFGVLRSQYSVILWFWQFWYSEITLFGSLSSVVGASLWKIAICTMSQVDDEYLNKR